MCPLPVEEKVDLTDTIEKLHTRDPTYDAIVCVSDDWDDETGEDLNPKAKQELRVKEPLCDVQDEVLLATGSEETAEPVDTVTTPRPKSPFLIQEEAACLQAKMEFEQLLSHNNNILKPSNGRI